MDRAAAAFAQRGASPLGAKWVNPETLEAAVMRDPRGAGRLRRLHGLGVVTCVRSPDSQDLHDNNKTVARPLVDMPYEELVPGA